PAIFPDADQGLFSSTTGSHVSMRTVRCAARGSNKATFGIHRPGYFTAMRTVSPSRKRWVERWDGVQRLDDFLTTPASSRCSTKRRRAGATRTPLLRGIIRTPVTKQTPHLPAQQSGPKRRTPPVTRSGPLVCYAAARCASMTAGPDPQRLVSAVGQSLGPLSH